MSNKRVTNIREPQRQGGTPGAKGVARSPELVEHIAAMNRARVPEVLEQPERKRCSKCLMWKNTARDFHWYHRKLKSGVVRYAPYPRCLECERVRARENRDRMSVEDQREKNTASYLAQKARRRRMRQESLGTGNSVLVVDVWPFAYWLGEHPEAAGELSEHAMDGLRRACRIQRGRVSLSFVDRCCVAMGRPDVVGALYGGPREPR